MCLTPRLLKVAADEFIDPEATGFFLFISSEWQIKTKTVSFLGGMYCTSANCWNAGVLSCIAM